MNAVQMMTGRGGWPMSVFLTPELKPFYGGTYLAADGRGMGMPGFDQVLRGRRRRLAEPPRAGRSSRRRPADRAAAEARASAGGGAQANCRAS